MASVKRSKKQAKDHPMIKSFTVAMLMSCVVVGSAMAQTTPPVQDNPPAVQPSPAQAQTPTPPAEAAPQASATPASPDDCLKAASDLAQSAEDRKLNEDKLDKIEELLTRMETHCDAKQFVEAMAVAKDIKTMIETQ